MNRILDIAEKEVGYLEKKSNAKLDDKTANAGSANYTKYWRDMKPSYQGEAWCNCFVDWVFWKAYAEKAKAVLCTSGDWSYYTPTSAQYFKNAKRWFADPQKGDVIYFKNSQRIHHVGIVTDVKGGYVYTIEGNTSSGEEVIPNGGAVCKKKYALTNPNIAGYGRPNYALVQYAVGWHQDSVGWWYANTTNHYYRNEWAVINGCWYYFNDGGYAVTGKQVIDGKMYFFCDEAGHPKECALMSTDKIGALSIMKA